MSCSWHSVSWLLLLPCLVNGCTRPDQPREFAPNSAGSTQPVAIHDPEQLRSVEIGARGQTPERVACETCHSQRAAKPLPQTVGELTEFHQGMLFRHGTLPCGSCHQVGQPPQLHLASGQALPMSAALELCAQCHGPQTRDYHRGSHGGMNGYWDLSRGARLRNHCVDCHDPHVPRVLPVHPASPPRDRFFGTPHAAAAEAEQSSRAAHAAEGAKP